MEQEYETTEVWYPYHGGGEMRESLYKGLKEPSNCAENSKLVATVKE